MTTKYDQSIEWMTGTGQRASVAVSLVTSREATADGDRVSRPCCEMQMDVRLDGRWLGSDIVPVIGHALIAGKCGILGIRHEVMAQIKAAIDAIETSPEWQANEQLKAQARQAAEEYDAGADQMRRVMGY